MVLVSYGKTGFYTVLEAYGEGVVTAGDMEFVADGLKRNDDDISFVLCDGITGVDDGVLVCVKSLREIVISDSVTHITVSEKLGKSFKKNKTVVRGSYDGYAMQFAKEQGLTFLHRDILIGEYEGAHESCTITLIFDNKGKPYIRENYFSTGSNAGNYGGGDIFHELQGDFYMNLTANDVADVCSAELYETVAGSETLKSFMAVAKEKGFVKCKF